MGHEQGPEHYAENNNRYLYPKTCSWVPVYKAALELLLKTRKGPILEIACGTGGFAYQCHEAGIPRRFYLGFDFTPQSIEIARATVPDYKFEVENVFRMLKRFNLFRSFVMLEFLEHINEDLRVLKAIPIGADVIFSVPNFKGISHVRHFNSINDIVYRYGLLLEFRRIETSRRAPGRVTWISKCKRRV